MNTETAVAPKNRDVRELLRSDTILEQIRLALPTHMSPDRMVRVMCTSMLRNPKLLDCRQESLVEALMICSQAGIEPDGRNAHLIPYGDKVQVIFDYKGLVAIAERNGVESIYADKVCDNDTFDAYVDSGVKKLQHRVNWKNPRGNAYAYYASCIRAGRLDYEVMTKDEVDAIRKRSKASGSGPWVTDYDEMAKKTVLRRMSKRWDLSPEARDAITADDDTPEFESSVTVAPKTPVFSGPPIMIEAPKATVPEPPRKRQAKPQPHDTSVTPAVAPEPPTVTPEAPKPVPVASEDDMSFETIVDGESAEVETLRRVILEAKIDDDPTVAEKKVVAVCVARKLIIEGREPSLASIKGEKYAPLTKNIASGALLKEIKAAVV